jgi:hypothetical protein
LYKYDDDDDNDDVEERRPNKHLIAEFFFPFLSSQSSPLIIIIAIVIVYSSLSETQHRNQPPTESRTYANPLPRRQGISAKTKYETQLLGGSRIHRIHSQQSTYSSSPSALTVLLFFFAHSLFPPASDGHVPRGM